ncbi:MAG: dienelactone hydrolase family protein [Candidatus Gracilibacteria bacterium]|nr:dienelactone hydrolase family protein [Candidatus Gracilibacteria bacterium]
MHKYIKITMTLLLLFSLFSCNSKTDDKITMTINTGALDIQETSTGTVSKDIFGQDFTQTVVGEKVSSGKLLGYYAHPKTEGNYPGIVMIHEWWGLNKEIKYMADLLANDGYNVFAIDLYDGQVADTTEKAMELSTKVRENGTGAIEKLSLAYDYLKNTQKSTKVASLGWCFGGQQSLNLSLSKPLDATVIYYGNLVTDSEKLKTITGPVLGIFGEQDKSISVESVNKFRDALDKNGTKREIHVYSGVGHAFANPTGNNYGKTQTQNAWKKTVAFLKENLK